MEKEGASFQVEKHQESPPKSGILACMLLGTAGDESLRYI